MGDGQRQRDRKVSLNIFFLNGFKLKLFYFISLKTDAGSAYLNEENSSRLD